MRDYGKIIFYSMQLLSVTLIVYLNILKLSKMKKLLQFLNEFYIKQINLIRLGKFLKSYVLILLRIYL